VFVSCSTLCFARYPLERAMRIIGELEFTKLDVAIHSQGPHLTPAACVEDVHRVAHLLKLGPSLTPAAFDVRIDEEDQVEFERQLQAVGHLARLCAVATITIPASPVGVGLDAEVKRLTRLVRLVENEGAQLCVATRMGTLTELPDQAVALCERVKGLGLTLDPSHFLAGPHQDRPYDQVFPFVRHVHLRDTGKGAGQFQVRVGQGLIEYGRLVAQLARHHYDRLLSVHILDIPDAPYSMEHEVRKLKYLLESLE
jgi:sugar phosphate isomerase/epimerase